MQRRSFLKLLVGAATLAASPSVLALVEERAAVPVGARAHGLIRETIAYDITSDRTFARYDVATKNYQFVVVSPIDGIDDSLENARKNAMSMIENKMIEQGIAPQDLISLRPVPGHRTDYI